MNKSLTIVIVTYNSEKHIFDCLNSIYKYNDIGECLEIVIVDNFSDDADNMFNKIRSQYPPDIQMILNPSNKGYGYANNQGIKSAQASKVIVMNPDVRIIQPVFDRIVTILNGDPTIGMMGVSFIDGTRNLFIKPEFSNFINELFYPLIVKSNLYPVNKLFFSGSFLVFEKQTFVEIGGFDEKIFLYHEEADISNRIIAINKKVMLSNEIVVQHLAHGRDVNKYLMKVGAQSRKYYFEKYNANLDSYYRNLLIIYRMKYIAALILQNKKKRSEFKAWIEMCKKRGDI